MIKVAENRYFLGFRPRQKLFFAFFATLLSLNYYNCKKINRPKPKKLLPLSFVYEYKYQKCHRMKGKVKYILFFLAAIALFSACKKEETEPTVLSDSVRVSAFSLAADTAVLDNLNNVFFTIDLENGLIFNADSLPRGTDVSSLAATISFEGASSAIVTQADGTTFDYVKSDDTKIDFTSPVTMEVVSQSGNNSKKYTITVNVHTVDADLLSWGGMSYGSLPGNGSLQSQKTVQYNGMLYCFMQRDGVYQVATALSPKEQWTVTELALNFTPDLTSIRVADNALYMLDAEGTLYSSTDAITWTAIGGTYAAILGEWDNCMLLISKENGSYYHDKYPRPEGYTPTPISSSFPISGMSEMLIYSSTWMTAPQGMIVGGRLANGSLTGAMWGYDGTTWAILSNNIPPREGAMLFPYVTFIVDDNWVTTEQTAWFIIGGKNGQTTLNDVWITSNYGVLWQKAETLMQMPAYILPRSYASVVICEEPANTTPDQWYRMDEPTIPAGYRSMPIRTASSEHLIPYIYMFGGISRDNVVYDQIWRGVINRLRFEPIP